MKTDLAYKENLSIETFILGRIHGKGNFPSLYEVIEDNNFQYLIESLMGPSLDILFKLCDKNFDFSTLINIGIDIFTNLKILHDLGFAHRDLKPNNLVFGNLSYENNKWKDQIGIIDFGHSKVLLDEYGQIQYSKQCKSCIGNKYFASNDVLMGNDFTKKDDIISVIYILIYFHLGTLPWYKKKDGTKLTKEEIIIARENINFKDIFKGYPEKLIDIFTEIIKQPKEAEPQYEHILVSLNSIKIKETDSDGKSKNKFLWMTLFEDFINDETSLKKEKKLEIKSILNTYSLNINEYLNYLKLK